MSDLISRKAAIELRDRVADIIGAAPLSSIHSALCEYANSIAALQSVGVTVKPLEWSGVPCQWGPETYQSSGVGGFYQVFTDEDSSAGSICAEFAVEIEHFGTRHAKTIGGWYGSFTEAKAAAQADYEARIMAALDVQPAPDVAQVRAEALRLGYRLGFEASGEGYNGEYMIGSRGRTIEENEDWVSTRDETLAALSTTPAPSPETYSTHKLTPEDASIFMYAADNPMCPTESAINGALGFSERVVRSAPSPDVAALVEAAYAQGAMDVHHNWQADKAPDFSEAARDYRITALARKGGT